MKRNYAKFFGMIFTSAILMYGIMFLNTYQLDHVYFSEMRLYMTILSTSVMTIVMLSFMMGMLKNKKTNITIVFLSVLIFATSFYFMRNQTTIDDVDYMRAMIPHHSIAILASERANITDSRVKNLANKIIETQIREIEEMKELLKDIQK